MAKKGRPNAWTEKIEPRKEEIIQWARAGATNKEIAIALDVGYSTFCDHVSKNKDFSDSLKEARMSGVPMVKLALMKRALGFFEEEVKTSVRVDVDGEKKQFIEKTKKYYPPDVGACQTFLRNNTEDFRDRSKMDYDFKEMEIELKKLQIESQNF